MSKKIIFLSGAITNDKNYKRKFDDKEKELIEQGYIVLNPTRHPKELDYEVLMSMSEEDICHCNLIYFFRDWRNSEGARREYLWAKSLNDNKLNDIKFIYEE